MTTNKIFLAVLVSAAFIDAVSSTICCGCFSPSRAAAAARSCKVVPSSDFSVATKDFTNQQECKKKCLEQGQGNFCGPECYIRLQEVKGKSCTAATKDPDFQQWCKDSKDSVLEQSAQLTNQNGGKHGREKAPRRVSQEEVSASLDGSDSADSDDSDDSDDSEDEGKEDALAKAGSASLKAKAAAGKNDWGDSSDSDDSDDSHPSDDESESDDASELNAKDFSFWIMGGPERVKMLKARFAKIRELYPGSHVDVCTFSETTRVEKVLSHVGLIDSIDCIHGRIGPSQGTGSSMWSHSPPLDVKDDSKKTRTKRLVLVVDFDCTLSREHLWMTTHNEPKTPGTQPTLWPQRDENGDVTSTPFDAKWMTNKDAFVKSVNKGIFVGRENPGTWEWWNAQKVLSPQKETPFKGVQWGVGGGILENAVSGKTEWILSVIQEQNAEVIFVDDSAKNYDPFFALKGETFCTPYENDFAGPAAGRRTAVGAKLGKDKLGINEDVMTQIDEMFRTVDAAAKKKAADDAAAAAKVAEEAARLKAEDKAEQAVKEKSPTYRARKFISSYTKMSGFYKKKTEPPSLRAKKSQTEPQTEPQ